MSVGFSIKHDLGSLTKELQGMGAKAPGILARSLNRAGVAGKTAMTRAIAKDTGIQSKYVGSEIVLDRANWTNQVTTLTVKGSRIPLIAFQAKGPEPSRGRGHGVSYRLPGGRGRIPNAFIATMKSGHRGVFKRSGSLGRKTQGPRGYVSARSGIARAGAGRLPIVELRGPSLPHVFAKFIESVFRPAALDALMKNLHHEIDFANRPEGAEPAGQGSEAA